MSKRILVAEASNTVRGVAETILRQNGYEVLSVPSVQKVLEVLEFSLPDVMLISAELKTEDGRPCYELVQDNPRTSSVPLLILAGTEGQDLPFPPEVVIPRPFDPRDLIQRVQVFSGQSEALPKASGAGNPLGDATLDDDLLDAALGLDRIDVTQSEVMDKTVHGQKAAPRQIEKMTGIGQYEIDEDEESRSGKVESLMIRDEHSEIAQKHTVEAKKKPSAGTSKIEIMDDQYGLSDPNAFKIEHEDKVHDYDWFVESMREENVVGGAAAPKPHPPTEDSSSELSFTDTSAHVDPITPGPKVPEPPRKTSTPKVPGTSHTAGVDKFIDEFKKEIEKIRSAETEQVAVETRSLSDQKGQGLAWEDKIEKLTPQQVELFTREFATQLADKIAERIAAKIDADKLLQLIKAEIIAHLQKGKR